MGLEENRDLIPSVYFPNSTLITPGCEWVLAGEGWPTLKVEGLPVKIAQGQLATRDLGEWRLCDGDPCFTPHYEAFLRHWATTGEYLPDGSYTLIGPHVEGNPEGWPEHTLVRDGSIVLWEFAHPGEWGEEAWDYRSLARAMTGKDMTGIVWWRDLADPHCDKAQLTLAELSLPRGTTRVADLAALSETVDEFLVRFGELAFQPIGQSKVS